MLSNRQTQLVRETVLLDAGDFTAEHDDRLRNLRDDQQLVADLDRAGQAEIEAGRAQVIQNRADA